MGVKKLELTDETHGIPICSAAYKLTLHDLIAYNKLITNEKFENSKRHSKRNFILTTIALGLYAYCIVYKTSPRQIRKGLNYTVISILWLSALGNFIFINYFVENWLMWSSKRVYFEEGCSRHNIKLDFYENRIIEDDGEEESIMMFGNTIYIVEDDTILGIADSMQNVFIIPKRPTTEEIIRRIKAKCPTLLDPDDPLFSESTESTTDTGADELENESENKDEREDK
jgi:hypothetical protein